MEYYIIEGHRYIGPFDMMSVVRKIRNRVIARETLVANDTDEDGKQAGELPEFRDIFTEVEERQETGGVRQFKTLKFTGLIQQGWAFLKNNSSSTAIIGMMILLAIGGTILLSALFSGPVLVAVASTWNYLVFALVQLIILRKSRMQLVTLDYLKMVMRQSGWQLLLCSAFISTVFAVPLMMSLLVGKQALVFILMPGSFVLMTLLFAPLLIVDRGESAFRAMGHSFSIVRRVGLDNFFTIYSLMLVNFIFGVIVLPIVFTLPMTLSAISGVYDEYFNEF